MEGGKGKEKEKEWDGERVPAFMDPRYAPVNIHLNVSVRAMLKVPKRPIIFRFLVHSSLSPLVYLSPSVRLSVCLSVPVNRQQSDAITNQLRRLGRDPTKY